MNQLIKRQLNYQKNNNNSKVISEYPKKEYIFEEQIKVIDKSNKNIKTVYKCSYNDCYNPINYQQNKKDHERYTKNQQMIAQISQDTPLVSYSGSSLSNKKNEEKKYEIINPFKGRSLSESKSSNFIKSFIKKQEDKNILIEKQNEQNKIDKNIYINISPSPGKKKKFIYQDKNNQNKNINQNNKNCIQNHNNIKNSPQEQPALPGLKYQKLVCENKLEGRTQKYIFNYPSDKKRKLKPRQIRRTNNNNNVLQKSSINPNPNEKIIYDKNASNNVNGSCNIKKNIKIDNNGEYVVVNRGGITDYQYLKKYLNTINHKQGEDVMTPNYIRNNCSAEFDGINSRKIYKHRTQKDYIPEQEENKITMLKRNKIINDCYLKDISEIELCGCSAILIQSVYRGHRVRNKFNALLCFYTDFNKGAETLEKLFLKKKFIELKQIIFFSPPASPISINSNSNNAVTNIKNSNQINLLTLNNNNSCKYINFLNLGLDCNNISNEINSSNNNNNLICTPSSRMNNNLSLNDWILLKETCESFNIQSKKINNNLNELIQTEEEYEDLYKKKYIELVEKIKN